MLKKIFIIFALILPLLVAAQDRSGFYKNQIKISPIRIVDLYNPGIDLSYERIYAKRFSTQVDYSFDKDFFGLFPFNHFHGYRFSLEEKYFLESISQHRKYISVDLVWNNNKYDDETTYQDSMNGEIKVDRFSINRKTFSVNLKYGKQVLFNHFILDFCVGAGIKFRNLTHYNRTHGLNEHKGINLLYALEDPGRSVTFNLPINLKIGYAF